jgi:hypothetical protein
MDPHVTDDAMTPGEHYREAERILAYVLARTSTPGADDPSPGLLALAQIHATLATVRTKDTVERLIEESSP